MLAVTAGRAGGETLKADEPEDQADHLKMAGGGGSLLAKMYQAPRGRHWWLKVCGGQGSFFRSWHAQEPRTDGS